MTDALTPAPLSDRWNAAPEPSGPPAQAAVPLRSDFPSLLGDALHAEASAPFVYTAAWEASPASSPATSGYQPASAAVADATQQLFDGWVNTLASWMQAGTATIGPQGDHIDNAILAANGDPLMRGGWS